MSEENLGSVKISDEVIAMTAAVAAASVEGVASLGAGLTENISINLRISAHPKGIKIVHTEEELIIDIYVNIYYGYKIPEVAWNIQESVKSEVEKITDEKTAAINIHVQGVTLEAEMYTEKKNTEEE